jgi:allophanate hydrolase subunit 2
MPAAVTSGLRILSPGLQSLIQDLGRPGHGGLGVSVAGALDRSSLRRANRIVGNQPSAAVVETVAGGLRVQAVGDQVLAVTGAPVALTVGPPSDVPGAGTAEDNIAEDNTAEDDGGWSGQERNAPMATAFALLDGEVLTLGAPERGFRTYLAVRGGVDTKSVLGSRSTDTMSGIGPAPLAAGGFIPAGKATSSNVVGNPEVQPDFPDNGVTVLDIVPGPRDDWFDAAALELLCSQDWTVTPRVQPRRHAPRQGNSLQRTRQGELASEGTVAGALQVPPEGLAGAVPGRPPDHGRLPGDRRGGRPASWTVAAQVPIGGTHPLPLGARLRTARQFLH